jgi:hypothetical protein
LFRIVENPEGRKFPFKFAQDKPRSIVAHSVGDQDFHFDLAKFLAKDGIEKRLNVADFIAARDNHGDMNRLDLLHGFSLSLRTTWGQTIRFFRRHENESQLWREWLARHRTHRFRGNFRFIHLAHADDHDGEG